MDHQRLFKQGSLSKSEVIRIENKINKMWRKAAEHNDDDLMNRVGLTRPNRQVNPTASQ